MALPTSYQTSSTVAQLLARPDIAPMFYVMISGLPYVFGNLGCPEAWDTGGGVVSIDSEDYTWSQTLIVGDNFGAVSQKAEPKSGFGSAGNQTFEFKLTGGDAPEDDLWLSLLTRYLYRSDEAATNLAADLTSALSGSTETISVDDASAFATSEQDVHLGTECVRVGSASNTSTTLHNIAARGAYKSWPQERRVSTNALTETTNGGPYVATWPLVFEGRVVRLRMALGVHDPNGDWRPYRDGSGNPVVQEVYKGVVTAIREGGDTLSVNVETASVDQLLANKIATRLPTSKVTPLVEASGVNRGGVVYVGPHNWYLSWEFVATDPASAPQNLAVTNKRLYTGGADVAEGLYDIREVSQYIAETIKEYGIPQQDSSTYVYGDHAGLIGSGAEARTQVRVFIRSPNIEDYDLWLIQGSNEYPTILRDLGFTNDVQMAIDVAGTDRQQFFANANEAPPAFRWPGLDQITPNRIYVDDMPDGAQDFLTSPGYVDDDGAAAGCVVLLSGPKELVKINGIGSSSVGNKSYRYLSVGARGIYNTGEYKDYVLKYDPFSDKNCTVTQGIYLPNTSLHRALFYLWSGGSGTQGTLDATWDKGWAGSGLALPIDLLNEAEITAVAQRINAKRDQIWIGAETELRKWLASELLLEQLIMLGRADFDTGAEYQLTWVETYPPLEYSDGTERSLDHSRLKTDFQGATIAVDRQENKIINAVKVRAGYNHATKKYSVEINCDHVTSQQTWGVRERITLDVQTISGAADAGALANELAQRVFDRYAHPYDIIELDAAYAPTWAWQIGDVVSVTHEALPAIASPGRGWASEPTRLYVKRDYLFPRAGTSSRLTMIRGGAMGARQSAWAPCALLTSVDNGGRTIWTVSAHEFSASDEAADLSYFQTDFYVLLWLRGTTTTANHTITAVDYDTNQVRFSSGVAAGFGSGGDVVMMLAPYGNISASSDDDAKKFAYMSAFDNVLNDGSVNDRPYRYL